MSNIKIKLGLFTVSLPPELSTEPPEVEELAAEFSQRAAERLKKEGFEIVQISGQMQSEEASLKAAQELVAKDVDCIGIIIGSWIYVPIVVTVALKLNKPFFIWGWPNRTVNSLCPAVITHGSLDEIGIEHRFMYGSFEDNETINQITIFARSAMVINRMDGMRYGLIGGRCMYMYTGMPDLVQIKSIFGVETEQIDEYIVILKAQEIPNDKVQKLYSKIKDEYGTIEPSDDIMTKSIRLYLALKDIIKERHFDFIGLKCLWEMATHYCTYCLPTALLGNEGIVVGCEADTNAALTMEILHLMSNQPAGFGDVLEIEKENGKVRLANCGSIATNMATSKKDVDWGLQYEFTGKGRGATTVFVCKPGRITLARLARIKGQYVMQITLGEACTESKERLKEVRDKWPAIFFNLYGDINNFIQNCRSNHQHWVYGDYCAELVELCRLLGIKPIIT